MDVEGILNQIRERVVSEHAPETRLSASAHSNGSAAVTPHDEELQRLRIHLAIAGRAADRLPPIFSNRQGTRARLELWIKNKSKPLTRWFTWEQINFNRAVGDALRDIADILAGDARELAALRGQLQVQSQLSQEIQQQLWAERAESSEQIANNVRFRSDLEGRLKRADATFAQFKEAIARLTTEAEQRASNYSRLEAEHANLTVAYELLSTDHKDLTAEHNHLAAQVIELAAQLRAEDGEIKSEQDDEINRRLTQMAADLKEEQHVCFRQISLETAESTVLADRARRALLARVEKLEEALKPGER